MKRSAVVLAALACTACSMNPFVRPDYQVKLGWDHTSHPDVGPPFGPADEEETLDALNCKLERSSGAFYAEIGLGYRLRDGGFEGSDFIFQSSVGIKLWSNKR